MASTPSSGNPAIAATSATRKHPHTPVRDNKSTSNILYIYTRAREQDPGEDPREDPGQPDCAVSESIKTAYYMALGYYPTPRNQEQLHALMQAGASPCLLVAVLEYTAEHAPRPTWAYAQCVIRRKLAEGIATGDAFERSVAAWYGQQIEHRAAADQRPAAQPARPPKRVIEQLYEQREYVGDKYTSLTPAEIEEALRYAQP